MSDLYFSWFELLLAKLQVLCNLLVSSGWYFLISAIFFAIFPSLLLIFATLSEINKMSRILSDLGGSPRNLLNFLIKPGTFFPSTLVAKEKTPSETARPIWVSISILNIISRENSKLTKKRNEDWFGLHGCCPKNWLF